MASEPEIDILVEAPGWERLSGLEASVTRAAQAALAAGGLRHGGVSILLTDDAAVRKLNAEFRGKDKPTNVLSFPAPAMPGDPEPSLGDIALAFETCASEAQAEDKRLEDHLSHLVIHGVLHLLGRDHEDEAEAEAMEAEETTILATLGIADPYLAADDARDTQGAAR
jgi:probable rRNA maturation factor